MVTPEPDEPSFGPDPASEGTATGRSLLRRLKNGQADASNELYLRYVQRLMALAAAQSSPAPARRVDIASSIQRSKRSVERVLQDLRPRLDALIGEDR